VASSAKDRRESGSPPNSSLESICVGLRVSADGGGSETWGRRVNVCSA